MEKKRVSSPQANGYFYTGQLDSTWESDYTTGFSRSHGETKSPRIKSYLSEDRSSTSTPKYIHSKNGSIVSSTPDIQDILNRLVTLEKNANDSYYNDEKLANLEQKIDSMNSVKYKKEIAMLVQVINDHSTTMTTTEEHVRKEIKNIEIKESEIAVIISDIEKNAAKLKSDNEAMVSDLQNALSSATTELNEKLKTIEKMTYKRFKDFQFEVTNKLIDFESIITTHIHKADRSLITLENEFSLLKQKITLFDDKHISEVIASHTDVMKLSLSYQKLELMCQENVMYNTTVTKEMCSMKNDQIDASNSLLQQYKSVHEKLNELLMNDVAVNNDWNGKVRQLKESISKIDNAVILTQTQIQQLQQLQRQQQNALSGSESMLKRQSSSFAESNNNNNNNNNNSNGNSNSPVNSDKNTTTTDLLQKSMREMEVKLTGVHASLSQMHRDHASLQANVSLQVAAATSGANEDCSRVVEEGIARAFESKWTEVLQRHIADAVAAEMAHAINVLEKKVVPPPQRSTLLLRSESGSVVSPVDAPSKTPYTNPFAAASPSDIIGANISKSELLEELKGHIISELNDNLEEIENCLSSMEREILVIANGQEKMEGEVGNSKRVTKLLEQAMTNVKMNIESMQEDISNITSAQYAAVSSASTSSARTASKDFTSSQDPMDPSKVLEAEGTVTRPRAKTEITAKDVEIMHEIKSQLSSEINLGEMEQAIVHIENEMHQLTNVDMQALSGTCREMELKIAKLEQMVLQGAGVVPKLGAANEDHVDVRNPNVEEDSAEVGVGGGKISEDAYNEIKMRLGAEINLPEFEQQVSSIESRLQHMAATQARQANDVEGVQSAVKALGDEVAGISAQLESTRPTTAIAPPDDCNSSNGQGTAPLQDISILEDIKLKLLSEINLSDFEVAIEGIENTLRGLQERQQTSEVQARSMQQKMEDILQGMQQRANYEGKDESKSVSLEVKSEREDLSMEDMIEQIKAQLVEEINMADFVFAIEGIESTLKDLEEKRKLSDVQAHSMQQKIEDLLEATHPPQRTGSIGGVGGNCNGSDEEAKSVPTEGGAREKEIVEQVKAHLAEELNMAEFEQAVVTIEYALQQMQSQYETHEDTISHLSLVCGDLQKRVKDVSAQVQEMAGSGSKQPPAMMSAQVVVEGQGQSCVATTSLSSIPSQQRRPSMAARRQSIVKPEGFSFNQGDKSFDIDDEDEDVEELYSGTESD